MVRKKNLFDEKQFIEISAENRESFNELVSEAFSATLCHRLGIFPETKKSQLAYIKTWKARLQEKSLLWDVTAMVVKIMEKFLKKKCYRLDILLIIRSEFLGR